MLFNIGFKMAMEMSDNYWDCFIFHDVDLLPEDDRNLYSCPTKPRHMSVGKHYLSSVERRCRLLNSFFLAVDKFKYKLPYKGIFGGVSAMTVKDFQKVNGFSNRYWGWGGEDDDLRKRIQHLGLEITRYSPKVAR